MQNLWGITLVIENHYKDDFWNILSLLKRRGRFTKWSKAFIIQIASHLRTSNAFLAGDRSSGFIV